DSTRRESAGAIKGLKAPVLGFLGMLHYKVDFVLLNYIAKTHPEWTLLLMGKDNIHDDEDRKAFNELKGRRNVRWCKEIDREAIPCFLSMADVCLVPLKKLEMNRYANFLKVWEYLAAGKPVVAVDQGVHFEYQDMIRFAGSKEEFVRNIYDSLNADTGEDLVMRRKHIAKSNSWENRTEKMLGIVEETLATRVIACNEV
ncbi:MAG TPA: glycosyltransferase, partial [Syntrophales bacterium]|nr:glycosyltransferase [Syntrophales bacterium]